MTLPLANNGVNQPEAKQLQWEINWKCYPDSVGLEQEHPPEFLWGPGGFGSEEAAGGQCKTLHFNCKQGKTLHSRLETRQMSSFS